MRIRIFNTADAIERMIRHGIHYTIAFSIGGSLQKATQQEDGVVTIEVDGSTWALPYSVYKKL